MPASDDEIAKHILGTIGAALVLLIVWRSSQLRTHALQQVVRCEHATSTTISHHTVEPGADRTSTPAGDPPSMVPGACAENVPITRSRPGSSCTRNYPDAILRNVSWAEPIVSASEETAITSAP